MNSENHFSPSCVTRYREYFKSVQFIVIHRPNLKAVRKDGYCLASPGVPELTGADEREPGSSKAFSVLPLSRKRFQKSHPPCHPPRCGDSSSPADCQCVY